MKEIGRRDHRVMASATIRNNGDNMPSLFIRDAAGYVDQTLPASEVAKD